MEENLKENKYIPFPYLILTFFSGLLVIIAKIHKSETFFPGAFVGLAGSLVVMSWITMFWLYWK